VKTEEGAKSICKDIEVLKLVTIRKVTHTKYCIWKFIPCRYSE